MGKEEDIRMSSDEIKMILSKPPCYFCTKEKFFQFCDLLKVRGLTDLETEEFASTYRDWVEVKVSKELRAMEIMPWSSEKQYPVWEHKIW